MKLGIVTIALLITIEGCSSYRGGPPHSSAEERSAVHEDLAYFGEYLKLEIHGEWLGGTNRVFALHLQATNSGSRSVSACIGENTSYLVASQAPHFSRWPTARTITDHPGCARHRSIMDYFFTLAPGESFRWSEYLELPDSFQGNAKGQATIHLMKPDLCTRYGCFSTTKVIETEETVGIEPVSPNPYEAPGGQGVDVP
jgi:hypothetical protein